MSKAAAAAKMEGSEMSEKSLVGVCKYRNALRVCFPGELLAVERIFCSALHPRALPEELSPSSDPAQLL